MIRELLLLLLWGRGEAAAEIINIDHPQIVCPSLYATIQRYSSSSTQTALVGSESQPLVIVTAPVICTRYTIIRRRINGFGNIYGGSLTSVGILGSVCVKGGDGE